MGKYMAESSAAPNLFYGRHLENAEQHVKNFTLWLATKKLLAIANPVVIGGERDMAQIAYFASTLRERATLWFNAQDIPGTFKTLALVTAPFFTYFLFDVANK